LLLVDKAFCLSAAEKRDYAAFFVSRQLIIFFSASGVIKTPAQLLLNYLISFSFSCTAEAGGEL
jgi:hypothetical protein